MNKPECLDPNESIYMLAFFHSIRERCIQYHNIPRNDESGVNTDIQRWGLVEKLNTFINVWVYCLSLLIEEKSIVFLS